MAPDHLVRGQVRPLRQLREIGTSIAAVDHWNVDRLAWRQRQRRLLLAQELRPNRIRIRHERIEMHRHGPIGGNNVSDAGQRQAPERRSGCNRPRVDLMVDHLLEFEKECRIAGVANSAHCGFNAASSLPWIPPKPPLDISTTTSPGRRSATTVEMMALMSGMWRACW